MKGGITTTKTYLVGPRGPEYCMTRQGETTDIKWYIYDGLGSVVAETDQNTPTQNASLTATRKYDVFGAVRGSTGTSNSSHRFVGSLGHMTDDATGGLIYMRARYMDPVLGRFVSEDPIAQGDNWYLYCANDPVGGTDATGKCTTEETAFATTEGAALEGMGGVGALRQVLIGKIYQMLGTKLASELSGALGVKVVVESIKRGYIRLDIAGRLWLGLDFTGHGNWAVPHWNTGTWAAENHVAVERIGEIIQWLQYVIRTW